jgi:hypothetical protein
MLQEYIQNVSVVSVLCCNKCFHVAICKCFIWMLHMFHTHIVIICSKCFICFSSMLLLSISCVIGREAWGARPGCRGMGATSHGPAVGAHRAHRILWIVLMPALGSLPPRDIGGARGRSGERGVSRGRMGVRTSSHGERGGGQGKGAAGTTFSEGACDEGGANVRTHAFVRALVSPFWIL